MNEIIRIEKPDRQYRIIRDGDHGFVVRFQPRNKRTGQPWQAARDITHLRASLWVGGKYGEPGVILDFTPVLKAGFDWVVGRIATEAEARQLVEDHYSKSV